MELPAREKWDERYRSEGNYTQFQEPRSYLVQNAGLLPQSGQALDAACGLGYNAAFLLERGFRVVGADISGAGLHRAHGWLPALMAIQADLAHFEFPPASFDMILNFYFLERSLFAAYGRWLRPGGILIFETLTLELLSIKPELNPEYLLKPGELHTGFRGWDILDYQEGSFSTTSEKQKFAARLIARRPINL